MNKTDALEKKIATEIKGLGEIHDLISETPVLNKLAKAVELSLHGPGLLLVRVRNDYPLLLETLKILRNGEKEKMVVRTKWFSCGVMLFSWKVGQQIEIWFECVPDAIPEELMPSDKCRVVENIKKLEKTYSIVCDSRGKNER